MLFPHAEWVIYVDTKYVVSNNPRHLIDYVKQQTNNSYSVATYARFHGTVRSGFNGAIGRLNYANQSIYNPRLKNETQSIIDQRDLYIREGLFRVYSNTVYNKQIDSAVLIIRNDNRAKRFFCAWQSEVSMFSRRDQLSFHSVQHHLQIYSYQIWKKEMFGGPVHFIRHLARLQDKNPPPWNLFNASNKHPFRLHPSTLKNSRKNVVLSSRTISSLKKLTSRKKKPLSQCS
jgi:hypothetical protein